MANVIRFEAAQVGAFLHDLKIGPRDDVTLRVKGGVARAHVKRASGEIHSATTMLGGKFRALTAFDSTDLSPAERRKVVKQLDKDGHTQTAIAALVGVTQATVSLDLKKIRSSRRMAK